jgi:competence protein ComEC
VFSRTATGLRPARSPELRQENHHVKRPLIPVAFCYLAGVLIARWTPPAPLLPLFVAAYAVLAPALAWERGRPILLAVALLLAGWINLELRTEVISPNDLRTIAPLPGEALATVRGVIRNAPVRRARQEDGREFESTTAQLDVTAVALNNGAWQPAFGRIVTATSGSLPEDFFAGQTVEIDGVLGPPPPPLAEGLFDYPAYLANVGIYHELHVEKTNAWRIVLSPAQPPLSDRFQAWAKKALARGLPREDLALRLEWALTLGWRQELTDEVAAPFLRAATYHIFAVDGLRIAIVAGILIGLFRAIGLPRAMCGVLAMPAICFYAAMTGWPASAVRAIVMIMVVFGGWVLKRPGDLINSLMAAGLVILVLDPRQLFEAGFQLSFLVVLCIILILPQFEEAGRWLMSGDPLVPYEAGPWWRRALRTGAKWTVDLGLTSVAAWLGSIPLVAYYFHLFTPVSGPANMPAVPLCALVLIANLASLIFAAWFPAVSVLFNHAGWFCMTCIEVASRWFAVLPGAWFYLPMPGMFTMAVYYLVLLAVMTGWAFRGDRRRWKLAATGALAVIWCVVSVHQRPAARLTVLPAGSGYAAELEGPAAGGRWVLDCGDDERVDVVVAPHLHAEGVNRLSNFILTHGEMSYSGGAEQFCDIFEPRNIYESAVRSRSPGYREFGSDESRNASMRPPVAAGETIGPWSVLHPDPRSPLPRGEDNAVVLRAEIGGARVLLLSDLGRPGQRALAEGTNDLRADIVVTGMPSEGEPLGDTLLGMAQPRVIVVADSEGYGGRRAEPQLRERLALSGARVFYMSECRAVTVTARREGWEVRAMDGSRVMGGTNAGH